MGRPTLPPRLILRQRGVNKYWYIAFRNKEYGLCIPEHDREAAEKMLLSFKARGGYWRRRLQGHKTGGSDLGLGTVYFLRMLAPVPEQPVKIGFTLKEEVRFHQVRTSSPWPLELIATVQAHQNIEIALHEKCAEARLQGEWFRPTNVVLDAISAARSSELVDWLVRTSPVQFPTGIPANPGQEKENKFLSY